jgi:hypothetical protein
LIPMYSGSNTSDQTTEDSRAGSPPIACLPPSGSGLPHSEIPGSKLVRSSPRLIAAYHVLHRLSAPRHPPNALLALDRSRRRCLPTPKPDRSRRMFNPPSRALFAVETHRPKTMLPAYPGAKAVKLCSRWSQSADKPQIPDRFPLHDVKCGRRTRAEDEASIRAKAAPN